MIDLVALLEKLKGKRFCISPAIQGQEGGAVYKAVRAASGGLTVLRPEDKQEVWINAREIEDFVVAEPPAERWDGTLLLRRPLAIGGLGVTFAIQRREQQ